MQVPRNQGQIIVVAEPGVTGPLPVLHGELRVVTFSSLEELDRWREGLDGPREAARPDIGRALEAVGSALVSLPLKLRRQLEAVGELDRVPALSVLESEWPSRRSFYRAWNRAISEPPSTFLRRARADHAKRLLDSGLSKKEAAHLAGFTSVDQMRRSVDR